MSMSRVVRHLPSLRSVSCLPSLREFSQEAENLQAASSAASAQAPQSPSPASGNYIDTVLASTEATNPDQLRKLREIIGSPLDHALRADESSTSERELELGLYRLHNSSIKMAGQMIQATVLQVDKKKITLDTGVKVAKIAVSDITPECIISRAPDTNPRAAGEVRSGDVVQVYLEYEETPEGDMLVSGQQAAGQRRLKAVWKELADRAQTGRTVKGRILNQLSGGYAVGVAGLTCFLPATRCSRYMANKIGDLQDFKILAMTPAKNNVILSDPKLDDTYRRPLPAHLLNRNGPRQQYPQQQQQQPRVRQVIAEAQEISEALAGEDAK